jgi:hypothetical protein
MLSNLAATVLLLAALAVVACYSTPESGISACREKSHRIGVGEIVHCPTCDG